MLRAPRALASTGFDLLGSRVILDWRGAPTTFPPFSYPKRIHVSPITTSSAEITPSGGSASPQPSPAARPPPAYQPTSKFCRQCGSAMQLIVPPGDQRQRSTCPACSYTDYYNPRLVVGAIVEHEGKVLLCRRGIEPQRGLWTVPAGFLELGESTAEGAARETMEEAGAAISVVAPYCHFDITAIGQAYVLFRARLAPPFTFAAQLPESLEAGLFALDKIPYDQLAFSSVAIALKHYTADVERGVFTFRHGKIVKRTGAGPNEPGSFQLEDLLTGDDGQLQANVTSSVR